MHRRWRHGDGGTGAVIAHGLTSREGGPLILGLRSATCGRSGREGAGLLCRVFVGRGASEVLLRFVELHQSRTSCRLLSCRVEIVQRQQVGMSRVTGGGAELNRRFAVLVHLLRLLQQIVTEMTRRVGAEQRKQRAEQRRLGVGAAGRRVQDPVNRCQAGGGRQNVRCGGQRTGQRQVMARPRAAATGSCRRSQGRSAGRRRCENGPVAESTLRMSRGLPVR